ncbi:MULTISPECIES: outer membrane protein assembly factor BamD [Spirosoma]|uniref:Outer membrane protein assembly factor BamD n=1 Tax=Spirosoma liriopis TaxID=2937440 RepID=A0ABT0HQF7_9BACT|nr:MULTISPECIES: outer membrane protein assembly factor BamD [Spirosoma]MCK8494352.1 outer membrane protein assembly factor BamD [Spirosoma liriopis]UHG89363.1 outer membrane protein assembly factor BamD [Spirosoma oryzicola]
MQQRHISRSLLGVLIVFFLGSCSPFSKLQKSGNDDQKYKAAVEYYKKEDWYHAGLLFEELIPVLKGSTESELAQFYHAYTQFHQQQYLLSATLFKKFYETFARSEYAQEAMYMYAYSLYKDTPQYNLDQSNTLTATSALQDFINTYPDSKYRDECTKIILELRGKLERKAYEKAKLYYKTSGFNIASYKSSVIAINNFQKEFPDSEYNEELAFMKVDAEYSLANNSLESKQKERYQDAISYYQAFIDKYPSSKYVKQAERMYESSQKEIERLDKLEQEREKLKNLHNRPAKVTAANQ